MEKYKELIITLIKNHRRYPGCEGILDDIVEEVCNKAASVVDTVSDDTIVRNYLIKAVSTAMITVPKRLNINTRPLRTLRYEAVQQMLPEETAVEETILTVDTDNEEGLVNIENCETEDLTLEPTTEEISEVQPQEEISISEEDLVDSANDELIENITEEESITTIEKDQVDSYDKTLVDKMINGVETDNESNNDAEQLVSDFDDLDNLLADDSEDEVNTAIQEEDLAIDETANEESLTEEVEPLELDATDNISTIEEIDTLFDDDDNDITENISEIAEEEENIQEGIATESKTENNEKEFQLPDFSCFNIDTPVDYDYNVDEMCSDINNLANKQPEIPVKKIWELKYIKGKSVSEIASSLEIDESTVLEILNDIINTVEG